MYIRSGRSVMVFSISFTVFAVLFAVVLENQLLDRPFSGGAWKTTVLIASSVAFPMFCYIGYKLMQITQLSAELQRVVNRDRLTDVATRDFFFDRMAGDIDTYGVSLMVDIDHFKKVNDTYGHLSGDVVIKHVSAILRREVRGQDIVCRFGGEEFVIFLYEASGEKGLLVAERIRMSVEAAPALAEGVKISVTVSIGGSLKERLEDVNLSIKQADEALYRAKNAGRNRTVVNWLPQPYGDDGSATGPL